MENAQRKSVLFVPASFKEGDINILSAGVQLCTRSGDSLKSKRVDLCYGGLIVNLVGVHDSSWGDWTLVEQVSLLQLTIYYVQSITNMQVYRMLA